MKKKFLNVLSNKLTSTTLHKGRKLLYPVVEIKIIQFIKFNCKLFNPISTCSLLIKLFHLYQKEK